MYFLVWIDRKEISNKKRKVYLKLKNHTLTICTSPHLNSNPSNFMFFMFLPQPNYPQNCLIGCKLSPMVSANASSTLNVPMLINRHLPYIDILLGFYIWHLSYLCCCYRWWCIWDTPMRCCTRVYESQGDKQKNIQT